MSPRNIEHPKRQSASLLDEVLERRMLLYVLAAGTALSGASAAQAKVVFTPSNAVLVGPYSVLQIDLDNDGVTDFVLAEDSVSISTSTVKTRKHPDGFSFFHVIGVYLSLIHISFPWVWGRLWKHSRCPARWERRSRSWGPI